MTLCTSIDTLAMTYLDDELADEELRDFELHMLDCAACRGRVDAERELIADLRRRLAPPPTPDVVRARLLAALDVEDAETARTTGVGRFAGWILPGVASVAAVAALAMFVFVHEPTEKPRSAAAVVAGQQMRSPQVYQPVVSGGGAATGQLSVHRVATWNERIEGHDATVLLYDIGLPRGIHVAIKGFAFDARGIDMRLGQHVSQNGLDLWVITEKGEAMVFYEGDRGGGYAFAAPELTARDLTDLVATYLIDDVGAR